MSSPDKPHARPPAAKTIGLFTDADHRPRVVGRDPSCDVVVDDPTVALQHLMVQAGAEPGRFELQDLGSSAGTWVDGRRVRTATVGPWDVIRLGARPVRIVELLAGEIDLSSTPSMVVGRDETTDIQLDHPAVSREHVRISLQGRALLVQDLASRNGVFIDGERVDGTGLLQPTGRLALGSCEVSPVRVSAWCRQLQVEAIRRRPAAVPVHIPDSGQLLLGRNPACDVVLDSPVISWEHARIDASQGRLQVTDLGSRNGTWVNGVRVKSASLSTTDTLALGSVLVALDGGRIGAAEGDPSQVRIDALELTRELPGLNKRILDEVSFTVFPGELVGVMGPSGSGKTTLLDLITGRAPCSSGRVLVNGWCMAEHLASFQHRLGYVPQDDLLHPELTVLETVLRAARLRLADDQPREALHDRVEAVLLQMGLAHVRDHRIGGRLKRGISGGQRRRVSIATALVTQPAVLVLDEPTSGLDASSAMEVVRILRDLASTGMTIMLTLHQPRPEVYGLLDRLVLLATGGKLAYFGPAEPNAVDYLARRSALPFDGRGNVADYLMDALEPAAPSARRESEAWQRDYLNSDECQQFVGTWQLDLEPRAAAVGGQARPRPGMVSLLGTLSKYYLLRKLRDRGTIAIQLLQAPVLALLVGWLFAKESGFGMGLPKLCVLSEVLPALFMLGAAALWLGCSNVARELVGDRPWFRRERLAGLGVGPYLGSVFAAQFGLVLLQTAIMVGIVWPMVGLAWSTLLPAWALLVATATCGLGLGLLVSSVASTEVAAISSLPLLLLPQLMLSGYLDLYRQMGDLQQALTALSPMRWVFEGLVGLEYAAADKLDVVGTCLGFPESGLVLPLGVLLGGAAALLAACGVMLSRVGR